MPAASSVHPLLSASATSQHCLRIISSQSVKDSSVVAERTVSLSSLAGTMEKLNLRHTSICEGEEEGTGEQACTVRLGCVGVGGARVREARGQGRGHDRPDDERPPQQPRADCLPRSTPSRNMGAACALEASLPQQVLRSLRTHLSLLHNLDLCTGERNDRLGLGTRRGGARTLVHVQVHGPEDDIADFPPLTK